MGNLCTRPKRDAAGDSIGRGGHRPYFHRDARDTLVGHALADHMRRVGEDLINIVRLLLANIGDIVIAGIEDGWGVSAIGAQQIGGRWQLFPVDLDIVSGIFGNLRGNRDDGGNGFADMPHAPYRQSQVAVIGERFFSASHPVLVHSRHADPRR